MFGDVDEMKYGSQLKTIRLKRRAGESFGFALRGGREHKIGFFVTQVQRGSECELQGLAIGDQVIRINGLPVEEALHKEMLNLIRSKTQVTLKVRSGALQPFYECTNQVLPWQSVRETMGHQPSWNMLHQMSQSSGPTIEVVRVTLSDNGRGTFGCSVCEGPPHKRGIYIQSMDENSIARMAGIKPGDQILQCNGRDFTFAPFYEAVRLLKESSTLNLVIAKGAGCDFISPGESSGYNSAASSINGDHSPVQSDKKRLSVVREEIIDIVDERRGLIVGSVTVDCRKPWTDIENDWDGHEGDVDVVKSRNHRSNSQNLLDEERRLQEERLKMEEAHKKLQAEAEKLAAERRRLEETRQRLLSGSILPLSKAEQVLPPPPAPVPVPVAAKQETATTHDRSSVHCSRMAAGRAPIHQQHEQLMEEFKEAHKRMFSLLHSTSQQPDDPRETKVEADVITDDRPRPPPRDAIHVSATSVTEGDSPASKQHHIKHALLRSSVSAPLPPPPPPLPPAVNNHCGSTELVERKSGSRSVVPVVPAPDYETSPPPTRSAGVTTWSSHQSAMATPVAVGVDGVELREKMKTDSASIGRLHEKRAVSVPATVGSDNAPVRISIGTYPSHQQRPQPAKLDFLPARVNGEVAAGVDSAHVKTMLQTELSQTLSRARLRQRLPDMELTVNEGTVLSGDGGDPSSSKTPATTGPPVDAMKKLSVEEKRSSLLMELKSRNESVYSNTNGPVEKKLAASARASTVAIRKSDPVSLFTPAAGRNTVNEGRPHSSTVVITTSSTDSSKDPGAIRNQVRFSTSATVGRKPAPEIQARMATLAAQSGHEAADSLAASGSASKPTENVAEQVNISQSADNKVTIQVSTYVSSRPVTSNGGILKSAASGSTPSKSNSRAISFGKT